MTLFFDYGSRRIDYTLSRRDRTTLEITVHPDGVIDVVVPIDASELQIAQHLRRRARWILRQKEFFRQYLPRTPARVWVPGETHLYLGRQYRLRIGEPTWPRRVRLIRGVLLIDGVSFGDSASIEALVTEWYRVRARAQFSRRLELCRFRFPDPAGFHPASVQLRRMPTRWGSMSASGRLSLNPDLVRAPVDAIDYVITHELCHLAIRSHGRAFAELLSAAMPDWEDRKSHLERALA